MKISVITVVFNDVLHIEETVLSVLNQQYEEVEYIVIDGASTDGTLEILEKYRPRLAKIVSEPDNGIYSAMNKGIALATGEIVGMINSGDRYLPGALKTVSEAFSRILQGSEQILWGDVEYENIGRVSGYRPKNRWRGAFAPHPSMFVPLTLYRKYGAYDQSFALLGDYEFMYRMVNVHHITPLYLPVRLAFYRAGGVSDRKISQCLNEEMWVKLRYGQPWLPVVLLRILKQIKNLPRILLAKVS